MVESPWRSGGIFEGSRSIIVLGTGGSAFVRRFLNDPPPGEDPLDAHTILRVDPLRASLAKDGYGSAAAYYWDKRSGEYADFVALAEAAGLGVRSKLGLLVHPEFGPWFAIRALLFTDKILVPTTRLDFDPCRGCPAPCATACPGAAVGSPFDGAACSGQRLGGATCRMACDARRACVIGRDHAYDADVEAFHMTASLRALGRG
jgi:hypothetical protein